MFITVLWREMCRVWLYDQTSEVPGHGLYSRFLPSPTFPGRTSIILSTYLNLWHFPLSKNHEQDVDTSSKAKTLPWGGCTVITLVPRMFPLISTTETSEGDYFKGAWILNWCEFKSGYFLIITCIILCNKIARSTSFIFWIRQSIYSLMFYFFPLHILCVSNRNIWKHDLLRIFFLIICLIRKFLNYYLVYLSINFRFHYSIL